jgi:quercetin dioxygenase-like cupin family protein
VSVTAPTCRLPVGAAVAQPPDHAPHAPLAVEALDDIAAGLACIERRVPASPDSDPTTPRSIRLIATANYDVWLITWPPGSEIGHHDHAGSTSVIRIVRGSLIESVRAGHWALHPGASVVTPRCTSHQLWNAGSTEATSLHVYSPPLTTFTYRPRPSMSPHPAGTASPGQSTPVRSRRAEASEARVAAPAPTGTP